MVNTRAQASQNSLPRNDGMDESDDNSSDITLPDVGTRTFELQSNERNYDDLERDHERVCIERRFNDMNRQIGELTSLVRTLTEKISSSNRV